MKGKLVYFVLTGVSVMTGYLQLLISQLMTERIKS